jgi:hypothetical protein
MLTKEQVNAISEQVNEKIDIPLFGEKIELFFIRTAVEKIDKILTDELPKEVYQTLNDASDGIDKKDIDTIKQKILNLLLEANILKMLDDNTKKQLYVLVLDIVINAMGKGGKL